MIVEVNNISCNVSFNLNLVIDGKPRQVKIDYPLRKNGKILLENDNILAKLYHSFTVNYHDNMGCMDIHSVAPNMVVMRLKGKRLTIPGEDLND